MDPLLQGDIAIAAIGIVFGLSLLAYAAVVLKHGARRTSVVTLIASSALYTAYCISSVVSACILSPTPTLVRTLLGLLTEALVTLAGFILLWQHAGKKYPRSQRIFEWVILALTTLLALAQVAFIGMAFARTGNNPLRVDDDDWSTMIMIAIGQLALRGVLVLDYLVSAVRLRKLVKFLATTYLPLLVLMYGWDTVQTLFSTWSEPTPWLQDPATQRQVELLAVYAIVVAAMIGTLVRAASLSAVRGSPSSSQTAFDLELRSQHGEVIENGEAIDSEVATVASKR